MNVSDEKKEQIMRDYWLGRLDDSQLETLETQWFSNDDETELLQSVRGDLIQDYLKNDLGEVELYNFQKTFLSNNLEDVAIAKSFFKIANNLEAGNSESGVFANLWEKFARSISIPQVAATILVFGVLSGISGILYFSYRTTEPVQVAKNEQPETSLPNGKPIELTDTSKGNTKIAETPNTKESAKDSPENLKINRDKQKTSAVSNKTSEAEEKIDSSEKPRLEEKEEKRISPQVLLLTGLRGSVRTLQVSKESKIFSIVIDMPGIDVSYKTYEVRIYDSKNNLVIQRKINENLSLKKSGERIQINSIDTSKLKKDNIYKTTLVGVDENKVTRELSSYDGFKLQN